ncbi:hypothetical protein DERF_012764 [Dermatophagoides farinae]|uniref:Uncharacterized protein n=1 Tax=Dermatophagoides farinae TaxID=6954 RepID=A0A922HSJ1_DERFA|nr:hypothetical protein DERF_012764 [Dermatophagoides farinae]
MTCDHFVCDYPIHTHQSDSRPIEKKENINVAFEKFRFDHYHHHHQQQQQQQQQPQPQSGMTVG